LRRQIDLKTVTDKTITLEVEYSNRLEDGRLYEEYEFGIIDENGYMVTTGEARQSLAHIVTREEVTMNDVSGYLVGERVLIDPECINDLRLWIFNFIKDASSEEVLKMIL
jgi:hypothetical protein